MAKMTPKQRRFCDEYLLDLNATQAAIRAGYSRKTAKDTGYENLKKPDLKSYIDARMAEKESELIAGQDEVLKYLTAVMRGESRASVLARDMTGADHVIDKPPDERERTRAAELLGKRYGLFSDQVHLSGPVPVIIDDTDSHDGGQD